jgi:hypothetical protein
LIWEAFIYLRAVKVQFTPEVKEILWADKVSTVPPVVNQDGIEHFELQRIECTKGFI